MVQRPIWSWLWIKYIISIQYCDSLCSFSSRWSVPQKAVHPSSVCTSQCWGPLISSPKSSSSFIRSYLPVLGTVGCPVWGILEKNALGDPFLSQEVATFCYCLCPQHLQTAGTHQGSCARYSDKDFPLCIISSAQQTFEHEPHGAEREKGDWLKDTHRRMTEAEVKPRTLTPQTSSEWLNSIDFTQRRHYLSDYDSQQCRL